MYAILLGYMLYCIAQNFGGTELKWIFAHIHFGRKTRMAMLHVNQPG